MTISLDICTDVSSVNEAIDIINKVKWGKIECKCCGKKIDYETLRLVNHFNLSPPNLIKNGVWLECEDCFYSECPACSIFAVKCLDCNRELDPTELCPYCGSTRLRVLKEV